jgi:hypothetical protein
VYYEVVVNGALDCRWSAWFHGLRVASDGRRTTIAGPVTDQAALHGLLTKVRDLGLELLAVHRTKPHRHPDMQAGNATDPHSEA